MDVGARSDRAARRAAIQALTIVESSDEPSFNHRAKRRRRVAKDTTNMVSQPSRKAESKGVTIPLSTQTLQAVNVRVSHQPACACPSERPSGRGVAQA